ncbi:MAG: aldo/keto reductase [Natronomonas sp.]
MEIRTARGVDVPAVGLGTWGLNGESCRVTVRTALETGYRHVDTAQAYDNERQVGTAIGESAVDRESVFLTTKLSGNNRGYDDVIRSVEESLAKLSTSYVDLLLIHWPNITTPLRETIAAIDELIDRGTVRHAGVSNFDVDTLHRARELSDHGILTNQVQYHVFYDRGELLDYCRIHDLLLTAYSPLAHGGVLDDEMLSRVGDRYQKTPAQVAIRWLIEQPNVVTVPKASSREHLEQNIDIFDFELTESERAELHRPSRLRTLTGVARRRLFG